MPLSAAAISAGERPLGEIVEPALDRDADAQAPSAIATAGTSAVNERRPELFILGSIRSRWAGYYEIRRGA
jgi:hypothetical protein